VPNAVKNNNFLVLIHILIRVMILFMFGFQGFVLAGAMMNIISNPSNLSPWSIRISDVSGS